MTFAFPKSITFTVTSTAIAAQVGTSTPLQLQAAAVHVGLRGLKGDQGLKGDTGDVHPDMPVMLSAAQDARDAAQAAEAAAETSATQAQADRVESEESAATATAQAAAAAAAAASAIASATEAAASAAAVNPSELLHRFGSAAPLPSADQGPIWHDGYASVMTWRVIGGYTGYASVNVGQLAHFDGDTVPPGYVSSLADISASAFAALAAFVGATTTRDARGVAVRGLDGGRGFDSGRARGSYQADDIKTGSFNVRRGADNSSVLQGASGSMAQSAVVTSTGTLTSHANLTGVDRITIGGAAETRMKNIALAPFWKY